MSSEWRMFGASGRGSSHEANGAPCQDAHAGARLPGGWVALAVADGAGSASLSQIGANLAVSTAIERAAVVVDAGAKGPAKIRTLMMEVIAHTRERVLVEARVRGVPPFELASTLLVALAGPELTATAHVGDGAVVVAWGDGGVATLSAPEPTEHPNETTFLTSSDALAATRVAVEERGVARIALMSDGLQMLSLQYPRWEPFLPFFEPLFRFAGEIGDDQSGNSQIDSLLSSKRVRAKTDDDVTLLIAGRTGSSPRVYSSVFSDPQQRARE